MSDREALAAALGYADAGKIAVTSTETFGPLETMYAAAQERLAQLPQKCGTCDGSGIAGTYHNVNRETGEHLGNQDITCPSCHGSGKVYPAETVERIGESMRSVLAQVVDVSLEPSQFVSALDELAVAVLDTLNQALNGETP